jgi:hypothetical protein
MASAVTAAITSKFTDAVSDLSLTGWAVLLVVVALFAARSLHRPITYRHLSRSEWRMIRQHRERQSIPYYLDNNGKKITKEQFQKQLDDYDRWAKQNRQQNYRRKSNYKSRPARGLSDKRYKNPDLRRAKTTRTKTKAYYNTRSKSDLFARQQKKFNGR